MAHRQGRAEPAQQATDLHLALARQHLQADGVEGDGDQADAQQRVLAGEQLRFGDSG